jgi:hypothetical protein
MSCDTNRGKLWKVIGISGIKSESDIFRFTINAQKIPVSPEEKNDWMDEKTNCLMALFDYFNIPRPVLIKKGTPGIRSLAGYAAIGDALEAMEIPLFGDSSAGQTKSNIFDRLKKPGEKASSHKTTIKVMAVGGAALALGTSVSRMTHDAG